MLTNKWLYFCKKTKNNIDCISKEISRKKNDFKNNKIVPILKMKEDRIEQRQKRRMETMTDEEFIKRYAKRFVRYLLKNDIKEVKFHVGAFRYENKWNLGYRLPTLKDKENFIIYSYIHKINLMNEDMRYYFEHKYEMDQLKYVYDTISYDILKKMYNDNERLTDLLKLELEKIDWIKTEFKEIDYIKEECEDDYRNTLFISLEI